MSSSKLNVSVRQQIVAALVRGSKATEVAECLNVPYRAVCSVADENAPLITHMMVERTNRLARKHDSEVRNR